MERFLVDSQIACRSIRDVGADRWLHCPPHFTGHGSFYPLLGPFVTKREEYARKHVQPQRSSRFPGSFFGKPSDLQKVIGIEPRCE